MKLTELLPLDGWVALEKEINRRAGLNASVFDVNGIRITAYKKWANPLCPAIKANEKGQTFICAAAHQNIAAIAQKSRKPVVEECDAGMVKIVVPIFVGEEFLGGAGGCGLLLGEDGEVDPYLVHMTTGIAEDEVETLARGTARITMEEAEVLGEFIAEELARIVEDYENR